MSDITIFKQKTEVSTRVANAELSQLAKDIAPTTSGRRIQAKNGKFHRLVNGEKTGSVPSPLNVIVVNALPKVSRQLYIKTYDPDAEATLPDCWSTLGDVPDEKASNPQSNSCATCPMNIEGTGPNGKGRACRFNRKLAVLLEGDDTGDVYQMNIPSLSLFGKGSGNVHPFESYLSFLTANGVSIDRIVTEVSLDEDADVTVMRFSPLRHITDNEFDLIEKAQANPITHSMVKITVAQNDGVTKKPKQIEEKSAEEKEVDEPVKRASSKQQPKASEDKSLDDVVKEWSK